MDHDVAATTGERPAVLVLGPGRWRELVVGELTADAGDVVRPVPVPTAAEVLGALASAGAEPVVAVVVVIAGPTPLQDVVDQLPDDACAGASILVVTDQARHDDVASSLDRGLLAGVFAAPWTPGALAAQIRATVARWARRRGHDGLLDGLADGARPPDLPGSALLRDLELDEVTVARRLTTALERALGPRPVLVLPAGIRLTRQDEPVNGVFVIQSGSVALFRSTSVGELRLHHTSTGPIVGLLSLAQQRRAYFTARTTTAVEVVHLTVEQLDLALEVEPEVGAAMAAASVRALAQRLRRSEQLQIERIQLNRELEDEQRRLSEALRALEAARLELVEQARMATLGELAAGVAHELNNPVAALTRAASFVADDVDRLLADHPHGALARAALSDRRTAPPRSTADERAARRTLAAALGDDGLARRLVGAGITDPDRARALAAAPAGLEVAERAAALGDAVRNLEVAGHRIAELVDALRAYARPDRESVPDVDVHAVLDDTLRLVAHRLADVEVVRSYGELPPIRGHPAQLGQVWTNLIVNAVEAMGGRGRLEITTRPSDAAHVEVTVTDDGPGIGPDLLPRLFEPRFTTKHGQVRYGLGLGLPIAKRIVDAHDGRLTITSAPGRTVATVTLPVAGPADRAAEEVP